MRSAVQYRVIVGLLIVLVASVPCSARTEDDLVLTDHLAVVSTAPGVPETSLFAGFGNNESVSMFSGNLLVTHPSSPSFQVGPDYSIGLSRVYNGVNNAVKRLRLESCVASGPPAYGYIFEADSWVGFGWDIHLGRIFRKTRFAPTLGAQCIIEGQPTNTDMGDYRYEDEQTFEDSSGTEYKWNGAWREAFGNPWSHATPQMRVEYFTFAPDCVEQYCPFGTPPEECECEPTLPEDDNHYIVTMPNGTKYRLEQLILPEFVTVDSDLVNNFPAHGTQLQGPIRNEGRYGWYTTEIEDVHGNKTSIEYWGDDASLCTSTVGQTCPYPEAIKRLEIDRVGASAVEIFTTDLWTAAHAPGESEEDAQYTPSSEGRLRYLNYLGPDGQTQKYKYIYTDVNVAKTASGSPSEVISLLSRVELPIVGSQATPDAIEYLYQTGVGTSSSVKLRYGALLEEIRYPTGGRSKYTYAEWTSGMSEYQLIPPLVDPQPEAQLHLGPRKQHGVETRTVYEGNTDSNPATWKWTRRNSVIDHRTTPSQDNPCAGAPGVGTIDQEYRLDNPDGSYSITEFYGNPCGGNIGSVEDELVGVVKSETVYGADDVALRTTDHDYRWERVRKDLVTGTLSREACPGNCAQLTAVCSNPDLPACVGPIRQLEASTTVSYLDDVGACFGASEAPGTRAATTTNYQLDDKWWYQWKARRVESDYLAEPRASFTEYENPTEHPASQRVLDHVVGAWEFRTAQDGYDGTEDRYVRTATFNDKGQMLMLNLAQKWAAATAEPSDWETWSPGGTGVDLITSTHTYTDGNLTGLDFSGGDDYPDGSPSQSYAATFSWDKGKAVALQVSGLSYNTQDVAVDDAGFVTSSTDSNGLTTTYDYDELGRVAEIDPPGNEFSTRVVYPTLNELRVIQSPGTEEAHSSTNNDQIYSDILFDGLGRPVQAQKAMPDGTRSVQLTRYDAMSRVIFVSAWVKSTDLAGNMLTWDGEDGPDADSLPDYSVDYLNHPTENRPWGTVTFYGERDSTNPDNPLLIEADGLGRVREVVSADGSATKTDYCGMHREVTVNIETTAGPTDTTTRYYYDGLERLVLVDVEPLADNTAGQIEGADAQYRYDARGQLAYVNLIERLPQNPFEAWKEDALDDEDPTETGPIASEQERFFDYNAIGRLEMATNPENGTTESLAYDALGNLLASQDQLGANRNYYFKSTYDVAGRLTKLERVFENLGNADRLNGDGLFESGLTGWTEGTIDWTSDSFDTTCTGSDCFWTSLTYSSPGCASAPVGSTKGLYFGNTATCSYSTAPAGAQAVRTQVSLTREDAVQFRYWRQVRGGYGALDRFLVFVAPAGDGNSVANRRNLMEVDQDQASFSRWRETPRMKPGDLYAPDTWWPDDESTQSFYLYLVFEKGDTSQANIGTGLVVDELTVGRPEVETLAQYDYDQDACGTPDWAGQACTHGPEPNRYLGKLSRVRSHQDGRLVSEKAFNYSGLNGRLSGIRTQLDWEGVGSFSSFVTGYGYQNHGLAEDWIAPYQTGTAPEIFEYFYARGLLVGLEEDDTVFVDPLASSGAVTYHPSGALEKLIFGNGTSTQMTRDVLARPKRVVVRGPDPDGAGPQSALQLMSTGDYAYDGAGNITAIGDQSFAYDTVGRLVTASLVPHATDPEALAKDVQYSYDAYGNMVSRDWGEDGNLFASGEPVNFEFFGRQHADGALIEDNRIHDSGFRYDANGNMTRQAKSGGNVGSTWNAQSRMASYYADDPDLSVGVVAERYTYDADGYRVFQFSESPAVGDGIPILAIRDGDGQLLAQFHERPADPSPVLMKQFVSGFGQLLVERDVVETVPSMSANAVLEDNGDYGFEITDNPIGSSYAVDIRTHSGIVAQLSGQVPDSNGVIWVDESNLADLDTSFVRVRREDVPSVYSDPVTVGRDSAVTGSSPNQVHAISASRVGNNVEIHWGLLQANGQTTYLHFTRADTGATVTLTPLGVPAGTTSVSLLSQAMSSPCGTLFTSTALNPAVNPSVGTETKNFGHLQGNQEPPCGDPPPPTSGHTLASSYHHRDHLGSLRVATDQAGATLSAHDYYPFGSELSSSHGSSSLRFTSHERDRASSMDYMLARYYWSGVARLQSVDPVMSAPDRFLKPSLLNLYQYAQNNPVAYTDPDGRDSYHCARPINSTAVKLVGDFHHEYVVHHATGLGTGGTVRSWGDDGNGKTGEVTSQTTGRSATTNATDQASWSTAADAKTDAVCVQIPAPDDVVKAVADGVISGVNDYDITPSGGETNSNAVATAVSNRSAAAAGNTPVSPGVLAPGRRVPEDVDFKAGTPGTKKGQKNPPEPPARKTLEGNKGSMHK